jgi:pyridoxine 5'-phosphate synthase PdxJ
MAGTIVANTINTDTGVFTANNAYLGIAKAWLNYNGVTQTIAGSFNISSVTVNGTGDYTVNFITAMPNANYSAVTTTQADSVADSKVIAPLKYNARTTTSVGVWVSASHTSTKQNVEYLAVTVFSA